MFQLEGQTGDVYSYCTQLSLAAGEYEYRFLVNHEWINPTDKEYNQNGNHVVLVGLDTVTVHHSLEPIRKKLT